MQVITDVIDVFPDGTITKVRLKTRSMIVTICREETNQNFAIGKIDVINQENIKEAINQLAIHLHKYGIYNIDVMRVDGSMASLTI